MLYKTAIKCISLKNLRFKTEIALYLLHYLVLSINSKNIIILLFSKQKIKLYQVEAVVFRNKIILPARGKYIFNIIIFIAVSK